MENASKALIIAGAILISIVLVTVGVLVVNSLNPDSALDEMSKQEKDTFNQKFVTNSGNAVAGSSVKTLIRNVITNNAGQDDTKIISVTITNGEENMTDSTKLSSAANGIITSHKYKVVIGYSDIGLVNSITITDNNKTEK